ncbi:MAG TPA: methyltransferase domain-containing protein [Mycobacterium sp.]|nr:methyltransferase domain-containing protein [Mycobacterium sp.]
MVEVIDNASVAMLASIGHRTSLFETMAGLPPATSAEIAAAAGLDERYVREWLGGMVTGRIVDYDPSAATYLLPRHRAAVLTRAAGPRNLAAIAMSISLLGEVEERIVDCFRTGGGLPYSEYPRFHAIEGEQSALVFDTALIDDILPVVGGLPERLRAGLDVADFGCGSGHAVNLMARAFPASRFTGIDFSDEALAAGTAEAATLGLSNAAFERRDLAEVDVTEAYDVITAFNTIHDQAQPAQVLRNIHAALRPGGVFLMVDVRGSSRLEENVGMPLAPHLYTVSTMHCMSVSLAYGGAGLGTVWGRQLATSMLADAGFFDVTVEEVDANPGKYHYVAHK